jgi:hypothetical protein
VADTPPPMRSPIVDPPPPPPPPRPRLAQDVIDAAISENRSWEWLGYCLTTAFAVIGLAVLVGAIQGNGGVAASGAGAGALFWPAMHYAVNIRRANIRIRLFEIALNQAKNGKEAAGMIREAMGYAAPSGG